MRTQLLPYNSPFCRSFIIGSLFTISGLAADVDFTRDIQPIFAQSCYSCHGPKAQLGGLRLDAKSTAMAGGQSGQSDRGRQRRARVCCCSESWAPANRPACRWAASRSTAEQIASDPTTGSIRARSGPTAPPRNGGDQEALGVHPAEAARAAASQERANWAANPIDRFILARLETEGLTPSPEADRVTLLRRLSLDLIGLPPTIAEVDAFLADKSPNAYEKQVDRLLASPALRRALGPHLARRGALRRLRRLREGQAAAGLVLSRLGHQRAQSRPALRPVRHRADRRRPAAERRRRTRSSPPASCATR